MAITQFGTNDAQTKKIWSDLTYYESLKPTIFAKLLGDPKDAVVGKLTELERDAGDNIKYDLLMEPTGAGVAGHNELEDNEEEMLYYQDSVSVELLRNGHAFDGMTQQRTVHDLRKDAKTNQAKWFTGKLDYHFMHQLGGDTALTLAGIAINTPATIDVDHYVICGDVAHGTVLATQEASLSNNDQIDLLDLDYAKERAKGATPCTEPAMFDGQEMFVAILHPYCMTDIRVSTTAATIKWHEIQQYANQRGLKNPIFTGAAGVYNNIILLENSRVYAPRAVGSGYVYRNLFLGKQAGVYAIANPYNKLERKGSGKDSWMSWFEQEKDYGHRQGIGVGHAFGIKPCVFNSKRLGAMVMSAYGIAKG
jgi:N4-gp56 family major capsid protein